MKAPTVQHASISFNTLCFFDFESKGFAEGHPPGREQEGRNQFTWYSII
jgi:hypothetical protein